LETSRAAEFPPGTALYGHPWHICPTVALHGEAIVVERQRAVGKWRITARDRRLSIPAAAATWPVEEPSPSLPNESAVAPPRLI
jgi:hypothetical protein